MKTLTFTSRIYMKGILILIAVLLGINIFWSQDARPHILTRAMEVSMDFFMNGPVTIQFDDPMLMKHIRANILLAPSTKPYNLTKKEDSYDPSKGQSKTVMKILQNMRDGFFVECGALDGETRSNTLVLEKQLGWSGLLVEADPSNFKKLKMKHRHAWAAQICLSPHPFPVKVMFKQDFNTGKIAQQSSNTQKKGYVQVQCLPLASLLAALSRTTVHYFSLDVEGLELQVLQTIPFDKIDIKILSVEFSHVPAGKEALRQYMESQGYIVHSEVISKANLANDFIFIKASENL